MRLGTVGEVVINEIVVAAFLGFALIMAANGGAGWLQKCNACQVSIRQAVSGPSVRILKAADDVELCSSASDSLPSFPPNTPRPLRAEYYFFSLSYLFNGLLPVLLASTCCASLFENAAAVLPPVAVVTGRASLLFRTHRQMDRLPQNAELLLLRLGSSSGEAMLLPLKKRTREWYSLLLRWQGFSND